VVTINRPFREVKLLIGKGLRSKGYIPEKAGDGGSTPSPVMIFDIRNPLMDWGYALVERRPEGLGVSR
jgi:hypothetical protein